MTKAVLLAHGPSGAVPILVDGEDWTVDTPPGYELELVVDATDFPRELPEAEPDADDK